MAVMTALHALAAVIWVGGMFFAYMALRPSVGPLAPPERVALWARVFGRFFPWVWVAVAVLLASGFWIILVGWGGFASAGKHAHYMMLLGLIMMALFAHLYFAPFRRLKAAVAAGDTPTAAKQIGQIRWIVAINLLLGLVTVVIGASGRYWG
ncbi:MAG: CopD family protein [Alphaproteobacteria bacterium]|nr:CopD family protein [Alphaproteobacteria bacterium]MCB9931330.1 CopD family protein [Alphaproteobacteria bacterium]